VFLFWFFPCCCFGFISKAATTKNIQLMYDLSMVYLGLAITNCLWILILKFQLFQFQNIHFSFKILSNFENKPKIIIFCLVMIHLKVSSRLQQIWNQPVLFNINSGVIQKFIRHYFLKFLKLFIFFSKLLGLLKILNYFQTPDYWNS
jgi:hypothetical protein